MSTRTFRMLAALSGIVGVTLLITSFAINSGPPSHPTAAQLITFGQQNYTAIMLGSWLQAVSPLLIVFFALAIVHLSGAATRLLGSITTIGCVVLLLTSLVEVTFYFSAVGSLSTSAATTGLISLDLIAAVQRLYAIVSAPSLFLPLALVILTSRSPRVLPLIFGYLALLLGSAFFLAGIIDLFLPIQNIVTILSIVQSFWWLGAAITLLVQTFQLAKTAKAQGSEEVSVSM